MKRSLTKAPARERGAVLFVAATLVFASPLLSAAEGADGHITERVAGGMPLTPAITSITKSNQAAVVAWKGFGGKYELVGRESVTSGTWQLLTATAGLAAETPLAAGNQFFQVRLTEPNYAGSDVCAKCHEETHTSEMATKHASALASLKAIGMDKNASCLPCHTVGYGFPTGFKDEASTPGLANVQCENCHGPAAAHAAKPGDLSLRPKIEISAKLCGGCHTDVHHPMYEEWEGTAHAQVTESVHEELLSTNAATVTGRINSCGACHSGSVRLAKLAGTADPSGPEAAAISVHCVVCHDPHQETAHGAQLRNPLSSMEKFSYSTSKTFSEQYNSNINLCGQCHNDRGASWTGTGRPPHHSPQYNMLVGQTGVLDPSVTTKNSPHRNLDKQCASCHMQTVHPTDITAANPVVTGHGWKVDVTSTNSACLDCHDDPADKLATSKTAIQARIDTVKGLLDQWATTKAPEALRTKYGTRAWETTSLGTLSNPNGLTISGPTAAEQTNLVAGVQAIPTNIMQARFNLYLVHHDHSGGAHNAAYARTLLTVAENKVKAELAK